MKTQIIQQDGKIIATGIKKIDEALKVYKMINDLSCTKIYLKILRGKIIIIATM